MAKVRVADYITEYLYEKFCVEHIFMLSGGGSIYLDDSVALHPHVKDICVRNEATVAMMANGYVKSGSPLGVAYVTTGPGSTNAVAGLAESWVDSCPVLIVSGQVNSYQTIQSKKQDGIPPLRSYGTQEIDILSIVAPITKKCLRLENPFDVKKYLDELTEIATTDRKGPVWLEVPLDVQSAYIDTELLTEESIESIIFNKIKNSKRPLILAGQGIKDMYDIQKFRPFLWRTNIPLILSRMGLSEISYDGYKYNLGIGGIKGRQYNKLVMKDADLVIAIGTTLSPAFVGHNLEFLGNDIIIVDVDESELNKFSDVDKNIIKVHMSCEKFCGSMLNEFHKHIFELDIKDWQDEILEIKEKNRIQLKGTTPIDVYDLVKTIELSSKFGDAFVCDAGSSYYVTQQTLEFNNSQSDITSGAWASMGVAIPLAIGASLRKESGNVIVIVGDGSIETNIQELKTLSYYGLNVKIFIINNGGYISMRDHQDVLFDGRYINATTETGNPVLNFEDVAKAFGLQYMKIEKYETMKDNIVDVLSKNGPILVEVMCDSNQKLINPISTRDEHEWMV